MLWVASLYFFCLSTRIKLGLVSPTKYIDHLSFKKKKQTSSVFGNKNCSQNILSFIFVLALRMIEINCVYFRNILTGFVKIALCQLTSRFATRNSVSSYFNLVQQQMAASESSQDNGPGGATGGPEEDGRAFFECNICLDTAKDAVVSMCGHLFW